MKEIKRLDGPRRQQGFTLLEIMLVVVLISISAVLVNFNISRDVDKIAALEAKRFAALVDYTREDSAVTGRWFSIGLEPRDGEYEFLELDGKWVPIERDDVYRKRTVPDDVSMRINFIAKREDLNKQGDKKDKKKKKPKHLIIDPNGEVTAFSVSFRGSQYTYVVELDDEQNIKVNQKGDDDVRS